MNKKKWKWACSLHLDPKSKLKTHLKAVFVEFLRILFRFQIFFSSEEMILTWLLSSNFVFIFGRIYKFVQIKINDIWNLFLLLSLCLQFFPVIVSIAVAGRAMHGTRKFRLCNIQCTQKCWRQQLTIINFDDWLMPVPIPVFIVWQTK